MSMCVWLIAATESPQEVLQPYILAIIAFIGVMFSGLISYAVCRYQISAKLHELREQYFHRLHEKRLEKYPALYSTTGKIGYLMRVGPFEEAQIRPHLEAIATWDHDNGAIAGPRLIRAIFSTRKVIQDAINENSIRERRKDIYMSLVQVEFEVKKEIGVYSSSNFDELLESKRFEQLFPKGN